MPPAADQGGSPPAYTSTATSNSPATAQPSSKSPSPTAPLPPLSPNDNITSNSTSTNDDGHDRVLPPLSSLTGGQALPIRSDMAHVATQPPAWPGLNSMSMPANLPIPPPRLFQKMDSPSVMELDTGRDSVVSTTSSDGRTEGRAQSVNLDDPDVRLAAEALGDLRAGENSFRLAEHIYTYVSPTELPLISEPTDFVSSPPNHNTVIPLSPPSQATQLGEPSSSRNPEPLFALLTTSHPLLATTIENASSAYGGAKNFSPRFKSGAEYVEGYLTPIANTVGSVGRVTGVEGGVRWFLGAGRRQRSDTEPGGSSKKRRKVEPSNAEPISKKRLEAQDLAALTQLAPEAGNLEDSYPSTPKGIRRLSMASTVETLPAYDDMRSPAYTETMDTQTASAHQPNSPWQSRLIMSTSGLSVAMSDESLRSLKYCLTWLRWSNDHIGGVITTLKTTLEQYEQPEEEKLAAQLMIAESGETSTDVSTNDKAVATTSAHADEPSRDELLSRINMLKGDVLKSLQDSINMVSRYAGGALPENARVLVRRHLTSLPQRFRLATMSEGEPPPAGAEGDAAVRKSAEKVLVLAKEGLDMVSQVSGIVDGTIVSAEEWCERMGKKRRDSRTTATPPMLPQVEPEVAAASPTAEGNRDVKMG